MSQRDGPPSGESGLSPNRRWLMDAVYPLIALAFVVVAWSLVTNVLQPPAYIIPSPGDVLDELVARWDELFNNMVSTARTALLGLLLSGVLGISAGFAIARSKTLDRLLMPPIIVTQSIPKIALAPLFVVWFGFGIVPKLIVVVLVTVFPVLIATRVGVSSVQRSTLALVRSMGLRSTALVRKVLLPASAPHLAGAFRVSASLALIGSIIAEYVGSSEGIGVVLLTSIGTQNTALTFAAILLSSLTGSLIYLAATAFTHIATIGLNPSYMEVQT
ncbi:MAG: ABC transporter permease subunit [Acidimicrobiia bacterium]|nr:ABC transporter permease subunit [Acidimicrobiia bacterium]